LCEVCGKSIVSKYGLCAAHSSTKRMQAMRERKRALTWIPDYPPPPIPEELAPVISITAAAEFDELLAI
jgi:hypothetical protein